MNFVEDFLANADLTDLPAVLSEFRPAGTVLLSSRRDTSRYATALLVDSSGRLRIVAKIVRRPNHQERLAAEFEILRLLAARGVSPPIAPLPLALAQHHGHWLLLETAVDGTTLTAHRLARAPERLWELVEGWLLELTATPAATVDEAWHAEQISGPLRRLEAALPATGEELRFFAATESLTHELTDGSLPAPVEHGDLFKPHMVISRERRLAAIDWELGRPEGLVGADAATFLLDVFRAPDATLGSDANARAYATHFLAGDGIARRWMQDHLEHQGLPRSWVDHILLAAFARRALNIWEPVVSETSSAPVEQRDHARALFRGFWSLRLWRMTLERMSG